MNSTERCNSHVYFVASRNEVDEWDTNPMPFESFVGAHDYMRTCFNIEPSKEWVVTCVILSSEREVRSLGQEGNYTHEEWAVAAADERQKISHWHWCCEHQICYVCGGPKPTGSRCARCNSRIAEQLTRL